MTIQERSKIGGQLPPREAPPLHMNIYEPLCFLICRHFQSVTIYYRFGCLKFIGFDENMHIDGLVPSRGSLISTQHKHNLRIEPSRFSSFSSTCGLQFRC